MNAVSTIQQPQATEPLTKPPVGSSASAQPPSIRAGGGGDSSAPHPDAPKTKSESNCIVRCFVCIKNQIVRFFAWICSLFSSGSKKLTEEEKEAEEREMLQTLLTEVQKGMDDLQEIVKERYKAPVSNDEQAILYLSDMIQIKGAAVAILLVEKMDSSNPEKQILSSAQRAIKYVKEYFEKHKSPRQPTNTERDALIGVIQLGIDQEHLAFVKDLPIHEDLLKFVSKMDREATEEEMEAAKNAINEARKNAASELENRLKFRRGLPSYHEGRDCPLVVAAAAEAFPLFFQATALYHEIWPENKEGLPMIIEKPSRSKLQAEKEKILELMAQCNQLKVAEESTPALQKKIEDFSLAKWQTHKDESPLQSMEFLVWVMAGIDSRYKEEVVDMINGIRKDKMAPFEMPKTMLKTGST